MFMRNLVSIGIGHLYLPRLLTDSIASLEPNLVTFMLTASARLRWQEVNVIPIPQVCLHSAVVCR